MDGYLLIESRDPFDSKAVEEHYGLAADLARQGSRVTLFLVQNGVLAARGAGNGSVFSDLAEAGVTVLADSFSLAERGIEGAALVEGVSPADLDIVVDALAAGTKTLWH